MSAQPTRDDEQQPLDAVESPGKRLRIARQARGMSRGDIATHLHLSQSMVQALENDDHDRLPGPVFVRGYLRNYARLLGLDDDSILAGYGGPHTDHAHHLTPVHQGVKPEIRSSHFAVRLVSWILVIGLLGLLAVWWQGHLEWNNGIIDQAVEAELSTPGGADSESGGLKLPQPGPDQAPDRLPQIGESTVEPARTKAPADGPPEEPDAVVEEATAPAAEGKPQTAAAETASETAAEEPGTGGEAAASEILFEFLGPCWVDIRDSTRKFKLFGEMSKGKRKVLEGTPPYSVILGNSTMVRVTVDGRPFDIEPLSHGSVARFTLDPGAAD
jgi:cytoskeleton protein RodZ